MDYDELKGKIKRYQLSGRSSEFFFNTNLTLRDISHKICGDLGHTMYDEFRKNGCIHGIIGYNNLGMSVSYSTFIFYYFFESQEDLTKFLMMLE